MIPHGLLQLNTAPFSTFMVNVRTDRVETSAHKCICSCSLCLTLISAERQQPLATKDRIQGRNELKSPLSSVNCKGFESPLSNTNQSQKTVSPTAAHHVYIRERQDLWKHIYTAISIMLLFMINHFVQIAITWFSQCRTIHCRSHVKF